MLGNPSLDFIPECYIDTNLVETLLGVKVNHQKGCNNVVKKMTDKYGNDFAVGIIDGDKRKVSYVDELTLIGKSKHLFVLKHPTKHHYMIKIFPAMEKFILSCVEEKDLDLSKYGFTLDLEEFKKKTQSLEFQKNPKFKELFNALSDSGEMRLFSIVLRYLNENRYKSDPNVLRSFFK